VNQFCRRGLEKRRATEKRRRRIKGEDRGGREKSFHRVLGWRNRKFARRLTAGRWKFATTLCAAAVRGACVESPDAARIVHLMCQAGGTAERRSAASEGLSGAFPPFSKGPRTISFILFLVVVGRNRRTPAFTSPMENRTDFTPCCSPGPIANTRGLRRDAGRCAI